MPIFKSNKFNDKLSKEEKQKLKREQRDQKLAEAEARIAKNNAERDERIAKNNAELAAELAIADAELAAKLAITDAELAKLRAEGAEIDAHNRRVWNEFKGEMRSIMRDGRERRRRIVSNAILENRAKRSGIIPINIDDLTFNIEASAENLNALGDLCWQITQQLESIIVKAEKMAEEGQEELDEAIIEEVQIFVEKNLDALLGEGAFELIYERLPNVVALISVVQQLITELPVELKKILLE